MHKTQVFDGKSFVLRRDARTRIASGVTQLIVNKSDSFLFWMFQDISVLLLAPRVAYCNGWGVRGRARLAAHEYWEQYSSKWIPLLEFCDANDIRATIYLTPNSISFEWYGPRREGWFGKTIPPAEAIIANFDEFVDSLESSPA